MPASNQFRLGRLPRAHNPAVPHMSALLAGTTPPPPPPSVDYTANMPPSLGMMLNDTLGDCTCAAFYHAAQVWTFNANPPMQTAPDHDVEELYIKACGYKPKAGGEGPGGVEQHVLTYLMNKGAPWGPQGKTRHKIAAFVEVDPRNLDDVKRAISDCGVAYIGFNVPQFLMPPSAPPPAVWDTGADTSIIGGHAVVLAGYDDAGARVISWGNYYTMTWRFFSTYVDEVYALADVNWVETTGRSPAGLSLADLVAQMKALAG